MSNDAPEPPCAEAPVVKEEPCASCDSGEGSKSESLSLSRKGQPWTEEEHLAFLVGLQKLGKGNWRGISKRFVPSRTPTQVASHAQKHFLRLQGVTKRKSRFAVVDSQVAKESGVTKSCVSKGADAVSAPSSNSDTTAYSSAYATIPFPCMVPPMMFAFPPPFLPPFMCPSSVAQGSTSGGAPGFYFPFCPDFAAGQLPLLMRQTPTEPRVVCKPEATLACSSKETVDILTALPMSKTASVEFQPSIHSAFRPPQRVRAS